MTPVRASWLASGHKIVCALRSGDPNFLELGVLAMWPNLQDNDSAADLVLSMWVPNVDMMNVYYVSRSNPPRIRAIRADNPAGFVETPGHGVDDQDDRIQSVRARRVAYDSSKQLYSFVDDAAFRNPMNAVTDFGMPPLPDHVPREFSSLEELLRVYLVHIVGVAF
jgi:hypothetical protein